MQGCMATSAIEYGGCPAIMIAFQQRLCAYGRLKDTSALVRANWRGIMVPHYNPKRSLSTSCVLSRDFHPQTSVSDHAKESLRGDTTLDSAQREVS